MRTILSIISIAMLLLTGCSNGDRMSVIIENTTFVERVSESVEVPWSELEKRLGDLDADRVVVLNGDKQIPSQVLYSPEDSLKAEALLFQVSITAKGSQSYSITMGEREEYAPQAYSRYVPERMGDYAWENNLVAYRAYGKPLEVELKTQGVDVWVKRTEDLIINKWYAAGHYHTDSGEGMDCYSVGRTLGGGASAPIVKNKIELSRNFVEWQRVANGPIRTEFILRYAPYEVEGEDVVVTRHFSLDANSRFTKIIDTYDGEFDKLSVGVGCMVHSANAPQREGADNFALYEKASDDKRGVGGMIGVSVIVPSVNGSKSAVEKIARHKVRRVSLSGGDEVCYYIGSGWSKGGVESAELWFDITERESYILANPLQITFR